MHATLHRTLLFKALINRTDMAISTLKSYNANSEGLLLRETQFLQRLGMEMWRKLIWRQRTSRYHFTQRLNKQ